MEKYTKYLKDKKVIIGLVIVGLIILNSIFGGGCGSEAACDIVE
tara:strand:- start:3446 stop:3577 length:132 start_codon:yes stop_codon:yes gene_type:complete